MIWINLLRSLGRHVLKDEMQPRSAEARRGASRLAIPGPYTVVTTRRKRRKASARNSPPITSVIRSCRQTTVKPAPR